MSFEFLGAGRLSSKYACVKCGYWVERGVLACPNCHHRFTEDDCAQMVAKHERNKKRNYPDLVKVMLLYLGSGKTVLLPAALLLDI